MSHINIPKMKNKFPGYIKKNEKEIKEIWDNGVICFDANVLLNLYRYSNDTRNALLDLIKRFSSQIFLPHQSALEYNKNRYEVIADQEKAYKMFITSIDQIQKDLQTIRKPPFLSDKLHKSLNKVFKEVTAEVQNSISKYTNFMRDDKIYEDLSGIFEGKITDEFSEKELSAIFKEGQSRFDNRIPPGFEDEKTKKGVNKFGDLVLWKQMIRIGKSGKKPIIFITDERKIDWWWKLKDGRNMGPRQELIEEMYLEAGVEFHMYSSERFLQYGLDRLEERKNDKALEEIAELKKGELENIELGKLKENSNASRYIHSWVRNYYNIYGLKQETITDKLIKKMFHELLQDHQFNNYKISMEIAEFFMLEALDDNIGS